MLSVRTHASLEVDELRSPFLVHECDHGLKLLDRGNTGGKCFPEPISVNLIHLGPEPFHVLDGMRIAPEKAGCSPCSTVQRGEVDDDVVFSCA